MLQQAFFTPLLEAEDLAEGSAVTFLATLSTDEATKVLDQSKAGMSMPGFECRVLSIAPSPLRILSGVLLFKRR